MSKIKIEDYLLVAFLGTAFALFHFGISWKALLMAMLIANGYPIFILSIYYIVDKFKK